VRKVYWGEMSGWIGKGLTAATPPCICRVTVTGIYRALPLRVNPRQRTVKAVYKTHIDVIHFRKTDTSRLRGREHEEVEDEEELRNQFSEERTEQLHQLSRLPDIYERLARALGE
jgi:DNA replication licensing factor MCM4